MVSAEIMRHLVILNLFALLHFFFLFSLTKNHDFRPKYPELLEQPFIKYYEVADVDIPQWFKSVVDSAGIKTHRRQVLLYILISYPNM